LFFFWGFITVMNDVLIPFLKSSFELSYFEAGLVQFAFFGAFFVVSLIYFSVSASRGDPINRIGYQRTIVAALVVCAAGCGLFSPAAASESYPFFLGALFLLATGVTLRQIAANPYAAILGKPENASSRLNLAQGLNSLGTTIAPIAGGLLLYKVFAKDGAVTLDAIQTPYLIYGGMFLALHRVATAAVPAFDHPGIRIAGDLFASAALIALVVRHRSRWMLGGLPVLNHAWAVPALRAIASFVVDTATATSARGWGGLLLIAGFALLPLGVVVHRKLSRSLAEFARTNGDNDGDHDGGGGNGDRATGGDDAGTTIEPATSAAGFSAMQTTEAPATNASA
jgi:MFS family permease